MASSKFPSRTISQVLLDALNEAFPLRSPTQSDTYPMLMWHGGERAVVDFLQSKFDEMFEPADDE